MLGFNPLSFPLHGQRLIEASAGTGKTYSIALLFLRLILERKLDVDQILVITFTKAATEELRIRINDRLREALNILEHPESGGSNACRENVLVELLSGIADREEAKRRLADALARMDEAGVYTIHGFCQRMLQENAFESGALFEIEFLESEMPLRSQIIEDFWRRRFYGSPPEEAEWAITQWNGPEGLARDIGFVQAKPVAEFLPAVSANDVLDAKSRAEKYFEMVCRNWQECGGEIEQILREDKNLSSAKKDGYSPERVNMIVTWMHSMAWNAAMKWVLPKGLEFLAASVMREKLKGKKIFPEHYFFSLFDDFIHAHTEFVQKVRVHTLAEACLFLSVELVSRKKTGAKIYYDDLLKKLDQALSGDSAVTLMQRIKSRFTVALIDEFQDTDPVQFRIARKLFGTGSDPGLFMVGDPKQAIYSFRGADIFTYINARRDTPEQSRFTMETNYRSTGAMVKAVNILFSPDDSFVFAQDIVFNQVKAAGKADTDPLLLGGKSPCPLQVMMLPSGDTSRKNSSGLSKSAAEEISTGWAAYEISRLLTLGAEGTATVAGRPLSGGDVAVLVRTHREANLMQQSLRALNIASVYYSQDSVFATDEAGQLYQVLIALMDLSCESAIRNALVTDLFGLNGTDLYQQLHDESKREKILAELQSYRDCWLKSGMIPMFQMLLAGRDIVHRMPAEPAGERKLTNYLHLVELLQDEARQLDGPDALLRWFSEQIQSPDPDSANQQLRLESDENLVRIITIHKAKGLEYPIVFLPYLWRTRQVRADSIFTFHEPASGKVVADLGSGNPEHYRLAELERLAEDLRLLYVAITRARHMCCFCWGKVREMEATPLAWLLHKKGNIEVPSAQAIDEQQIAEDLLQLNAGEELLDWLPSPQDFDLLYEPPSIEEKVLQAKTFSGRIDSDWAVTSYSQLAAGEEKRESSFEFPAAEQEVVLDETKKYSVFSFPRGPAAGNCLHNLLEQLDFIALQGQQLLERVEDQLKKTGIATNWAPLVCGWLQDIGNTPLDAAQRIRLADLNKENKLAELGFYFSMHDIDFSEINRVLAEYSFPQIDAQSAYTKGLMKGFIDLVFVADGRFYIADYKSNYLGPTYEAYRPEHLSAAMFEHRYELQYLIYSVALHRYLGKRITGYDYATHFGGVFYLFLRGMHPDAETGNGIFFTRPPGSLVERFDRCFGYPEGANASIS